MRPDDTWNAGPFLPDGAPLDGKDDLSVTVQAALRAGKSVHMRDDAGHALTLAVGRGTVAADATSPDGRTTLAFNADHCHLMGIVWSAAGHVASEHEEHGRSARPRPARPDTRDVLDSTQALPSLSWLRPGRIVQRIADTTTRGVRAWVPCHDGQSVHVPDGGAHTNLMVRCKNKSPRCGRSYRLTFDADGDGGWYAVWEVEDATHILDTSSRYGEQPG